jgi:hypothetical protein
MACSTCRCPPAYLDACHQSSKPCRNCRAQGSQGSTSLNTHASLWSCTPLQQQLAIFSILKFLSYQL